MHQDSHYMLNVQYAGNLLIHDVGKETVSRLPEVLSGTV